MSSSIPSIPTQSPDPTDPTNPFETHTSSQITLSKARTALRRASLRTALSLSSTTLETLPPFHEHLIEKRAQIATLKAHLRSKAAHFAQWENAILALESQCATLSARGECEGWYIDTALAALEQLGVEMEVQYAAQGEYFEALREKNEVSLMLDRARVKNLRGLFVVSGKRQGVVRAEREVEGREDAMVGFVKGVEGAEGVRGVHESEKEIIMRDGTWDEEEEEYFETMGSVAGRKEGNGKKMIANHADDGRANWKINPRIGMEEKGVLHRAKAGLATVFGAGPNERWM